MKTPKKQTVESLLADTLSPLHFDEEPAKYNKLVGAHPMSLIEIRKEGQRLYNKRESDFTDAVRYATWPGKPAKPPSLLQKLWWKITWPLGLRIVHENNICDCEDC